jgi:hypothetical protein
MSTLIADISLYASVFSYPNHDFDYLHPTLTYFRYEVTYNTCYYKINMRKEMAYLKNGD